MREYGYIPESPEQSWGNNKGIFSPNDIYDLTRADKWTTLGALELIETQTISSAFADFTNLQADKYNVHFFTYTDCTVSTQTEFGLRVSNDGGSSYRAGEFYEFANKRGIVDGSFANRQSTGQYSIRLGGDVTTDARSNFNGYTYMYNAGDSAKFTYFTSQTMFSRPTTSHAMEFGSAVYDVADTVNAIRIGQGQQSVFPSGQISLYGIRYT